MSEKQCSKCKKIKSVEEFNKDKKDSTGYTSQCKQCRYGRNKSRKSDPKEDAKVAARIAATYDRLASDSAALKPEDFDVSVGNMPRSSKEASQWTREKRQEFNKYMGQHGQALRNASIEASKGGDLLEGMSADSGTYIGRLAEQERRFGNRRLHRSIALAEAHEALSIRRFKQAAADYLKAKITPTGYALRPQGTKKKRSVCLLLSDLHLGSELSNLDNPIPFRAVEEARRLEHILHEVLNYKPQYRESSELVLMLNGDLIEGQLMHDFRDGAPLTEQKVIFWEYFRRFIGYCAQQYPSVRVFCQPGNHGRDKVRHPGRATSRKWDGHEWELYYGLMMMSSDLQNVKWQLDFRAITKMDLHGSVIGLTHGDTEVKIADPDTKATQNQQIVDRINSARLYDVEFDGWCFGHFHKPRYQPRNPKMLFNGALVPPNGHARTSGYIGEPCGQWLWESVEGHPFGDLRFISVGLDQDNNEDLGKLIVPFRFID